MERFRQRSVRYLRRQFPDECGAVPEPQLRERIDNDIAKARSYKLKTERELTMYLTLSVGLGPDLHRREEYRWARKLLYDESMDGAVRMGLIFKLLAEREAQPAG